MHNKRIGLMLILYGIVFGALILTLKLADWAGERMKEDPKEFVFDDAFANFAIALPIWVYVAIYIAIVAAVYITTRKIERKKAMRKMEAMGLVENSKLIDNKGKGIRLFHGKR
jgi:phosphatidylglycerophosphatase A